MAVCCACVYMCVYVAVSMLCMCMCVYVAVSMLRSAQACAVLIGEGSGGCTAANEAREWC